MKAKLLLALAFLAGAIVAGCAHVDQDHARAYVSSSVAFAHAEQDTGPAPAPQPPVGKCAMCNNTGCVRSGGGEDWLPKCPSCGRQCSRSREASPTPVAVVGGRPVTFFTHCVQWSQNSQPNIHSPQVGEVWVGQDGVQRRWGGTSWQVKRCYGRGRCFWENER
jgi:hypothetical protein